MASPLTVFVCSTYADLAEERHAVLDAIRRLQLQHDSMEFFGARTGQPLETCLAEVRKSNVMVVIVGHRYGSLAPEVDISYSEAEYQEARRLHKPCLVYLRDDNVPVLPKHVERDPQKLALLERWKATLTERHTVASFSDGNGLAVQVAADLGRTIHELNEIANARQEPKEAPSKEVLDQMTTLLGEAIENGATPQRLLTAVQHAIQDLSGTAETTFPSVFFSYSHHDADIVCRIANGLSAEGISIWIDELSLSPGDNWVQEIEDGLSSADFVVFFISPQSVQKGWALRELQVALERQVSGKGGPVLIPVLLETAEAPPLLRNIHWLDMSDGNVEKGVRRLRDTLYRRRIHKHLDNNFNWAELSLPELQQLKRDVEFAISVRAPGSFIGAREQRKMDGDDSPLRNVSDIA